MDTFDRIEYLLRTNGMSQSDLSKATGISTGLISQWKKRTQNPSISKLAVVADYFGVTVDYLLGNSDEKEKPVASEDDELNEYLEELKTRPEMRMLFSLAKGATKQDVEQAVAIVEALFKARGGEQ